MSNPTNPADAHADAAGKLCTDDGTGRCRECGVGLDPCDACDGVGYHVDGCAESDDNPCPLTLRDVRVVDNGGFYPDVQADVFIGDDLVARAQCIAGEDVDVVTVGNSRAQVARAAELHPAVVAAYEHADGDVENGPRHMAISPMHIALGALLDAWVADNVDDHPAFNGAF